LKAWAGKFSINGGIKMKEIKVALGGCGFVTNDHLKAWRKINNAKVVAVSDLNGSLAKRTAEFWRIPHHYTSFSDMIKKEEIDLADICTPPHTHAALAVESMEAGVNVLIEKPMAMTMNDAEKIVACQKRCGVKAGVIHNWLFEEPVLEACSFVNRGLLGEVFNVEIETLNTKDDPMASNEHHWCHKLHGGRFSEMLAHPIYLVRHFLKGEVKLANLEVSKVGSYPWIKSDELYAAFKVGYKSGRVYASLNSSRDAIYISLYGRESIIKLEVVNSILTFLPRRKTSRFSKGSDSLKQAWQIVKYTGENVMKVVSKTWMSGTERCIKLFSESLMENNEPLVSVNDGLSVVKTLEEMCAKIAELEKKVLV